MAFKYKTKFEVEGQGELQIEVTNYVNTKTFKERQTIPSLLNMANMQRIKANREKRIIQEQFQTNNN